ncbi:MAG: hypothetical protein BWY19_00818 [bacterium ADurb.Bin212]|nr:MAG: hypothetical protein BWY19_00818 [bacterium ADurb.Bin212]
MAKLVSLSEYARIRGVNKNVIFKGLNSGIIPYVLDEKGNRKIDVDIANKAWEENKGVDIQVALREEANEDPSTDTKTVPTTAATYAQSRSIREAYTARLSKLSYEEKLGKLISAEKVKITAFNTARIVRENILNVPNKIAYQLAAETDPNKINFMLTEALIEALEELAVGKLKL